MAVDTRRGERLETFLVAHARHDPGCRYHPRESETGWECQMTDGVPRRLPPWWIDPHRTPQRDTRHHITNYVGDDQRDAA